MTARVLLLAATATLIVACDNLGTRFGLELDDGKKRALIDRYGEGIIVEPCAPRVPVAGDTG